VKEAATLIKRARKYMRSAQMLLEHKDYESCVSRTYYAMFYCAQAALVTKYLSKQFRPRSVEGWLEIPLDSAVAKGLKSCSHRGELPRWPGLPGAVPTLRDPCPLRCHLQYCVIRRHTGAGFPRLFPRDRPAGEPSPGLLRAVCHRAIFRPRLGPTAPLGILRRGRAHLTGRGHTTRKIAP